MSDILKIILDYLESYQKIFCNELEDIIQNYLEDHANMKITKIQFNLLIVVLSFYNSGTRSTRLQGKGVQHAGTPLQANKLLSYQQGYLVQAKSHIQISLRKILVQNQISEQNRKNK
ncbi:Hypothetical_protein [Hexamita inflata]|uniref:Hypothetical_protein n=1 Tax=Hexamita inflata TaxID=28002 RepID=A0AA86UWL5_9EUKA|nr:Hypothetical protein HINF_LOCUS58514 [Hexamita inflata]